MKLPSFILLGAHKGGTTSIHEYLDQHPNVYLPPVKGLDLLKAVKFESFDEPAAQVYLEQFTDAPDNMVIGEVSSTYLHQRENFIEKLNRLLPNTKLIAILRNPIDRAYSSLFWKHKFKPGELENLDSIIFQPKYLNPGCYATHLTNFFSHCDRERFLILLFDDLKRNPQALMSRIYDFVGVASDFEPDTHQKLHFNPTAKVDNWSAKLLKQTQTLNQGLKQIVPPSLRSALREKLQKNTQVQKPTLPLALQAKLVDYYRDEVYALEDLIGQDCSHWL
ncbi:MAG: sulfotransferase domain-containing protein, partial [Prochlorotrichaceae cyanobacterium]